MIGAEVKVEAEAEAEAWRRPLPLPLPQSLRLPSSILLQLCKVQVQRWPQGVFSHFVNFPLFATSGPLTRGHAFASASLAASFAAAGNCLRFVLLSFEIIIKIGL